MSKLSKLIILVFLISLFGCLGIFIYAGGGDNTSGFAWSENIGWVSFNSTSDGSPIDYGVNIDFATGDLSGQAWSEHVGWVSFNRSDTGDPPAAPFSGGSGPIAQYNSGTGALTGWMRVLANGGGWDGWVRFEDATIDASGDWHGFAWSDMVVGWLSFNSVEGGGSAYKVTSVLNNPPTASNLNVVKGDYCASPPVHYFSWIYTDPDGNDESQFQFQVDNDSGFGSPEVDQTITGTWSDGDSNDQTVIVVESPIPNQIGYNATYYWRVKVWDSWPAESIWVEGSSFTTEPHRYPLVNFTWSPLEPSAGEDVQFTDTSVCYTVSCTDWNWDFETDGTIDIFGQQNPTWQFTDSISHQVTLWVTDADGNTCPGSQTVSVQIKLPGWKEILPW